METYLKYLDDQVDKAIYVRGAQGQNVLAMTDPEGWIRTMETTRRSDYAQHVDEYNRNADRAIALYRQRKSAGINPIRAFDCSGLTMYYAQNKYHLVTDDYSAAGIYNKLCVPVTGTPTIRGQLIFRSSTGSPSKITHMGTYVGNGQIIECRGRDYGVIKRAYNDAEWTFTGEWSELMKYCCYPQPVNSDMKPAQILVLQQAINALGYTDAEYHPLKEDGKLGPRTAQALEQLVRYNIPDLTLTITRSGSVWAEAGIE